MFNNPGKKIKNFAVANFIIDCLAAIIGGIILIANDYAWVGVVTIAGGLFTANIIALLLYGFGELVENSSDVREKICNPKDADTTVSNRFLTPTAHQSTEQKTDTEKLSAPLASNNPGMILCPKCKCEQSTHRTSCWKCGTTFKK